jgi:long-chain acyl-CoA synthetase
MDRDATFPEHQCAVESANEPGGAGMDDLIPNAGNNDGAEQPVWLKSYPADVDWTAPLKPHPMAELFDRSAEKFGDLVCTNFLGKTETYASLAAAIDRTAAGLQDLGLEKGDRVGLLLPNCPTFIIYYFAILKAGGIVVNYNPLYTIEELAHQVADSGTRIMVTLDLALLFDKADAMSKDGQLEKVIVANFTPLLPSAKAVLYRLFKSRELADLTEALESGRARLDSEIAKPDGTPKPVAIDPEQDIAVLQYTGGTTGTPKGAILTHANLSCNVEQVALWAPGLEDGKERVLGALPFFHVFAMTVVMNFAIRRGAEIIIMPRFQLDDALKLITRTKPTVMPGVPTLFNAMLNHPKLSSFDLSSLKFCLSGGAALPLDTKTRFESITGCKLVEGYGLSETSPVATCNPIEGQVKDGSIGIPLPQTRLTLRDLEDPEKEVPPGERGEIAIAGPQVMRGYWQNDEATAATFVGEYFRTGDVAVCDEDGFFFIVDRIKDLILCSGYNVYPRRIEEAIQVHPAVEEVTVIGIPDDYRGEAPMAFVKIVNGKTLTEDELFEHLKPKLSKIEMPAKIAFRDELPKTMIGKLSKKELREEMTNQTE